MQPQVSDLLWQVTLRGVTNSSHPRDGGSVPVRREVWVVAPSRVAAEQKIADNIDGFLDQYSLTREDISVQIIQFPLEDLVPARNTKHDNRAYGMPAHPFDSVELTLAEDLAAYRFEIRLVRI